jgi:hypothetical protein
VTAEETAAEHAVGRDGHAELARRRQDRVLDAARQQRVLDLHVGDGVDRVRAPQRVGAHLGQAEVADVPGTHQVGDRAHGVLDGDLGIDPRRPVDVDVVGAEAAQGVGEVALHRLRAGVVAEPRAARVALRAELDADDGAVARAAGERAADEQLVVAHAVEVAGVEERDAGVERRVDGGDALGLVGRAVEIGHAHAAETHRRHAGTCLAERTDVHGCLRGHLYGDG